MISKAARYGAGFVLWGVVLGSVAACTTEEPTAATQQQLVTTPAAATPSAPKATPPAGRAPHPLAGVASIVEADVSRVWSEFDSRLGPRTFIELSNAVTVAGRPPQRLLFSQLGGKLPDGSRIIVSELADYSVGARYVFFFGRQASVFTAVWAGLSFRVEKIGRHEIVLGRHGNVVLEFGVDGVRFGQNSFVKPNVEATRPLEPASFNETAAEGDPEVAKALSAATFLEDAVAATTAVGGPLGEAVELEPPPNERWDETSTTPALEAE